MSRLDCVRSEVRVALILVSLWAFLFIGSTLGAASSVIEEIPQRLSEAMGITQTMAELILSAAIMGSVVFGLAILKVKAMPITVMLLVIMAVLYAMSWMDISILVLACIAVGGMWAGKMRGIFG